MNNEDRNAAAHAAVSDPTAPINTEESMAERIARIKRDQAEANAGESSSPTSGLVESSNKSTTAASATRDASDPQRSADKPSSITRAQETAPLGQAETKVSDGSKTGERVRSTTTGLVPESNDVMLGDQSTRKDGPKDTPLKPDLVGDGSKSPHDASSDGSRQDAAHQQVKGAAQDDDDTPPAFRASAKAATI